MTDMTDMTDMTVMTDDQTAMTDQPVDLGEIGGRRDHTGGIVASDFAMMM